MSDKSDTEFIEFTTHPKGELLSINIHLEDEEMGLLKDLWYNEVKSCQAPLVGGNENGFTLFIPWILKTREDEVVDPEEPDEWSYSEPEENDT